MAAEAKAAEPASEAVVSASATAEEVAEWLTTTYKGGRRAALAAELEGADGHDLYHFSKGDLKELCGNKAWGVALHNDLHGEMSAAAPIAATRPRLLRPWALRRRARAAPPAFGDPLAAAPDVRCCAQRAAAARRTAPPA